MRVAFVSHYDAHDVRHWSGTGHYIARSLERQGAQLDYVGPLRYQKNPVNAARHVLNRYIRRQNDHPQRDPGFLRHYATQVARHLAMHKPDVIVSPGSLPIAYLASDRPIVMWTDCTFANLLDYYPKFSNLSARTIRDGHEAERQAIARCSLLIFSSDWAAESAIRDYGADPARVHVVPFGANLSDLAGADEVEQLVRARDREHMHLLFLAVEWDRKGGDIAVEMARAANEMGTPTTLHLVGCRVPERHGGMPFIEEVGFLDKRKEADLARLRELLRLCHFLAFPSRAECYGIAVCEASAYGMPSFGSDTGGVPSAIREGINGRLLPLSSGGDVYAAEAVVLFRDQTRYEELALTSRKLFESDLNWDVAAQRLHYWITKPA